MWAAKAIVRPVHWVLARPWAFSSPAPDLSELLSYGKVKHRLHLKIAGLQISTSSEFPIKPNAIHEPYRPFLGEATDSPDIRIELTTEAFPGLGNLSPLFDSDESWSLYRKEDEYQLLFNPQASKRKPFWQATFDSKCSDVTVYCNPSVFMENGAFIANPIQYPLDQLLLMYHLASRGGVLIHAAGIEIRGKGYIFPGISGAGKSTLIRQFLGAQRGFRLLSDDRIFLRRIGNDFKMFGTPWPGEAGIALNESAPLSGVFFLQHGEKNDAHRLEPMDVLAKLIPVLSVPWFDEDVMPRILHLCEGLIESVPAYQFQFKPARDVVQFLETFALNGH